MLPLLLVLLAAAEQELAEALRQATSELAMFRLMYAAIWIPMFGGLIVLSLLNYLQYKRTVQEFNEEQERAIILRKDLHTRLAERHGDIETYVNALVEKALEKS